MSLLPLDLRLTIGGLVLGARRQKVDLLRIETLFRVRRRANQYLHAVLLLCHASCKLLLHSQLRVLRDRTAQLAELVHSNLGRGKRA